MSPIATLKKEADMNLDNVMLPDWVGVLGSALIAAVIVAAAIPAFSDEAPANPACDAATRDTPACAVR
jgi:hypothetical protein